MENLQMNYLMSFTIAKNREMQIRDKKVHRKHIATMNPINAKEGVS